MSFVDFKSILGQVKAETSDADSNSELPPFLFSVHAVDASRLRFLVTDCSSNTFEAFRSVLQLEDMKDNIGIGGSWSEFLGYVTTSIRSTEAKLVLKEDSKSNGDAYAMFIAQKSKGMPRISIPLIKLTSAAAEEAKAKLSLELYGAYENICSSLVHEKERCLQLTKELSAEKERCDSLEKQLDMVLYSKKHKLQQKNDKTALLGTSTQDSPTKQASTRTSNRVVPAYRRAKSRGAFLQNTEDNVEN